MIAKVSKWGNSFGVRIPKPLLEVIGVSDNDDVEIIAENKTLILKPARERLTLDKLFKDYQDGCFEQEELDWGPPVGDEVW